MISYTISELKQIHDDCLKVHHHLAQAVAKAFLEGRINQAAYIAINQYLARFFNAITDINVAIINSALDSISLGEDSPGAQIRESIRQLNQAADQIEEFQAVLRQIMNVCAALASIIEKLLNQPWPIF